jgi:ABC-type polysaccharide/polyol phosphate transport system ATPase subunit
MAHISFQNVSLRFPLFDARHLSLRKKLVTVATGGVVRTADALPTVQALSDVTFEIKEGDSVGLIGHNGAGKSTLLRTIAGIYKATAGTVKVQGNVSNVFDLGAGFDHEIDGRQNIVNWCLLHGFSYEEAQEVIDEVIAFSELENFIDLPVHTYSSGMLLRLLFSLATVRIPDIFLLDEMFSTGDAAFQSKSSSKVKEIIEGAKIFVFASHDLSLIEKYCNRIFRLEQGQIIQQKN